MRDVSSPSATRVLFSSSVRTTAVPLAAFLGCTEIKLLTPDAPTEALVRLHLIGFDELEEEEVVDEGDKAEDEQRSGEEESRAAVPTEEPVVVTDEEEDDDVGAALGPVGLGVPALLREQEEEDEVGDKMELLLRAFLWGLRHVLPGSLFTMCCISDPLTDVFISQSEPE